MALDHIQCDGELSEFQRTSRAAEHCQDKHDPDELCDKMFTSLSKDILKCNYLDLTETDQIKSIANISDSLILIHLNIRSLNKNFDEL